MSRSHIVGWAWHPFIGLLLILLPIDTLLRQPGIGTSALASWLDSIGVGVIGVQSDNHAKVYLLISWVLCPVLVFTLYRWLVMKPGISIRDRAVAAGCGIGASALLVWVYVFAPWPQPAKMPIGRGWFLVAALTGPLVVVYVVNSVATIACALIVATTAKTIVIGLRSGRK